MITSPSYDTITKPDRFQLLVVTEGLQPGELLWFGNGEMKPLSTTADELMNARLIAHWYIVCDGCHPKDTEQFLKNGCLKIVKDERKVQLLIQGLAAPKPARPADPTDILDA